MKLFHCDQCRNALFFENVQCLHCGSDLAFLPTRMALAAIEQVPQAPGLWRRKKQGKAPSTNHFRLCHNNSKHQACNFAVPEADPNPFCVSCRLTQIVPDLSVAGNRERWFRTEAAKRRLFYTLARLGLVSNNPANGLSDGPVFQFLADLPGLQVMTGHMNGVVTLNIAEADDDERVKRRLQMREPYRTLLGHFRHESGHYYWDTLIRDAGRQEEFRAVFGDEQQDYRAALQSHYANGAMAGWQASFVSAYAASHPWEDWAETWAHYLHMVDLLETAAAYNTRLAVPGDRNDADDAVVNPFDDVASFELLVEQWVPLTLLVNSMNRSLGQEDAYPFALSATSLDKLRFVHNLIQSQQMQPAQARDPAPAGAPSQAEAA